MTDLRRFARRQGVELKVVKNTLTRLAAQEAGIGSVLTELTETNALLLGEGTRPSRSGWPGSASAGTRASR